MMGKVFAYDSHDGFPTDMFLTQKKLSDAERYCAVCDDSDTLIAEVISFNQLSDIMREHGIQNGSGEYERLISDYQKYLTDK